MISRLVRMQLRSRLHELVLSGGTMLVLLVLFVYVMWTLAVRLAPASDGRVDLLVLSAGVSSVLLAVAVFRRHAREKRTRLLAELPVSTLQVSVASWYVRLLGLWIPVLAYAVVLARVADLRFATLVSVVLATYLGATTLVAAMSVALTIPHLPLRLSAWVRGIYLAAVLVAVVIWVVWSAFVFVPAAEVVEVAGMGARGVAGVGAPGLVASLLVSAVGLVLLDVWLRGRADDYLG